MNTVDFPVTALCQIRSKKFDIISLSAGTEEGEIVLFQYPPNNNIIWDIAKAHIGGVNHINYSRDTNLLFSAGADGNLFIYCLYELPDGENIEFDEKISHNINHLTNIIDEGLGDNVLYPLDKIFKFEDNTLKMKNQLLHASKKLEDVEIQYEMNIKEKESQWQRIKNSEVKLLEEKLKELEINKDVLVSFYEEKIEKKEIEYKELITQIKNENNQYIDQLNEKITELTNVIESLRSSQDIELK
jgi:SMC interacting uncharacterized protein involved in chromosome segregation